MSKIGLYFGTFNPIHIGHIIIANHMVEYSDLDEIWMVVTPHNPFKKKSSLLDNHHRLELVYRATENYSKINPSDIEFKLPQPNYTVHTLAHITDMYPNKEFCLIMGEDNLKSFKEIMAKTSNNDVTISKLPGLNHLLQRAKTGHTNEYGLINETINAQALSTIGNWLKKRF